MPRVKKKSSVAKQKRSQGATGFVVAARPTQETPSTPREVAEAEPADEIQPSMPSVFQIAAQEPLFVIHQQAAMDHVQDDESDTGYGDDGIVMDSLDALQARLNVIKFPKEPVCIFSLTLM